MADADDELARAKLWQAQRQRRLAFRQSMNARLAGNGARAQQVRDAWQPLLDADNDRARSEDAHCD